MDQITVMIVMDDSTTQDAEVLRATASETIVRHPSIDSDGQTAVTIATLDRVTNQVHDAVEQMLRDMGQVQGTLRATGDLPAGSGED